MRKYFEKYVSNTLAGTSCQTYFESDEEVKRGRVYYKLFKSGTFEYSLLFSNTTDGTVGEGRNKVCNIPFEEWRIHSMRVGIVSYCDMMNVTEPDNFSQVYFEGEITKVVHKGEIFCCDAFVLSSHADEYMCLEIEFSGKVIPCHEEIWIASFVAENGKWCSSYKLPTPSMVGCDRNVLSKICFLGDSITQGIGTTKNKYSNWCAQLAEMLGKENSYWNLGIGRARSSDAASDGAWLYKAKQTDTVFLCLGVNDIVNGKTEYEIVDNLRKVISILKAERKKIIIQSVPPFDYSGENIKKWLYINQIIKDELSKMTDGYFDCVPILGKSIKESHIAKYGGHPDDDGCRVWAKKLYDYVKNIV